MCAKTHVAPSKIKRTILELELCVATLLVEILEPVSKVLQCPAETWYECSNSAVALLYLAHDASYWKPFVANHEELPHYSHQRSGVTLPVKETHLISQLHTALHQNLNRTLNFEK